MVNKMIAEVSDPVAAKLLNDLDSKNAEKYAKSIGNNAELNEKLILTMNESTLFGNGKTIFRNLPVEIRDVISSSQKINNHKKYSATASKQK